MKIFKIFFVLFILIIFNFNFVFAKNSAITENSVLITTQNNVTEVSSEVTTQDNIIEVSSEVTTQDNIIEVSSETTTQDNVTEISSETTTNEPIHWADDIVLNLEKNFKDFKPVQKKLYNLSMPANEFFKNLHMVFNQKYIEKYFPKNIKYLTREEASVSIQNILNINKQYIDYNIYNEVKDFENASYWAKKGIEEAIQQGLLNLDKNNNFRPKSNITYAEGYTIINKILNKNYNVSQNQFFEGVNKTYRDLNIIKTPFNPNTKELTSFLKNWNGVSVYYKDLYSNVEYVYNQNQQYGISSVGKAPYIMYIYYLASIGEVNLNEKLIYKEKHRKDGSGTLKNQKSGGSYTIAELCEYALRNSDNTAINILSDRITMPKYKKYLESIGYKNVSKLRYVTGADITVNDAMFFIENINDFIENNKYGKVLKEHLLKAGYPFIVSDNYQIARKSGWWNENFHDIAIVYAPRPYLLVICSNKSGNFKLFKDISNIVENIHTKG